MRMHTFYGWVLPFTLVTVVSIVSIRKDQTSAQTHRIVLHNTFASLFIRFIKRDGVFQLLFICLSRSRNRIYQNSL